MGTIIQRPRRDGTVAYMAQIAVQREGRSHRESQTFDRRPAAAAWIKKREAELSKPGALALAQHGKRLATLGDAIDSYIAESKKKIGRTKSQVLRAIKADDIADIACADITSQDLVAYAGRLGVERAPATVANYLSHLRSVFAIAQPAWGYPLDEKAMADTFKVTKRLGVTGKSKDRTRRPTLDELDRLLRHFEAGRRKRPRMMPMAAIVAFALYSSRREEEITKILWTDLDVAGRRVLVRDMKDPEAKDGNDVWCELPEEALRIALAQPRNYAEIFPYNHRTVSANMTRACAILNIADLHFHDLRHEGVSRLLEMGRTIPQAASVSGHRNWSSMKRYAHLRQTGDKYLGWVWLDRLAPAISKD
ncbi:putative integrase/recombinase [Bosea sp. LC85]|uniref:site-specific integrase n=1 Tax=Bosea sp. LC85 TaxID=1502851 RepID=UPI0004E299AF|nr:tyrosine-type recombinase/integrase [Bosea sp. LC85]KFC63950.1 putative integrase/recombinase [Bosea sp. LC85]